MLFTDPRTWSRNAVGSRGRFAFMAVGQTALIVFAVYLAADGGLRSGLAAALMPIVFQFFSLYALRRMYRQAIGAEPHPAGLEQGA